MEYIINATIQGLNQVSIYTILQTMECHGSIQTSITETALLLQFEGGNYNMRAAFDRRSTVYHQRYTFRRYESNKTVSQQALVLSLSIADTIESRAWFI